jgi:hypothetical protein
MTTSQRASLAVTHIQWRDEPGVVTTGPELLINGSPGN